MIKEKFRQYLQKEIKTTNESFKLMKLFLGIDVTKSVNPFKFRNGTIFMVDGNLFVMVDKEKKLFFKLSEWTCFGTGKDIKVMIDESDFLVINELVELDIDKYKFYYVTQLNHYYTQLVNNLYKGNIDFIPEEFLFPNKEIEDKYNYEISYFRYNELDGFKNYNIFRKSI